MLEELGSGAGGTVYKALHAASLRLVVALFSNGDYVLTIDLSETCYNSVRKPVIGRPDVTFLHHAPPVVSLPSC